MKTILVIFILLHGFIHLLGFVKGFELAALKGFQAPVSRPLAVIWLIAFLFFLLTSIWVLINKNSWWMLALPAILISQVLMISSWKDARWGTVANLILLIPAIIALAENRFHQSFNNQAKQLLQHQVMVPDKKINREKFERLPAVVQNWLKRSGCLEQPDLQRVRLYQSGQMKTKPAGRWMPFQAEQVVNVQNPSFVWKVKMNASPLWWLSGVDSYAAGKGSMKIRLFSLLPIVNNSGPETDQGSLLRFLAETCWYPSGVLNEYIEWKEMDSASAQATIKQGNITASGIFFFNKEGDMIRFEAMRYMSNNKQAPSLEKWIIENRGSSFRRFEGIRIPTQSDISWELKQGRFTWMQLTVDSVYYNKPGF